MSIIDLDRKPGESELSYINRLGSAKEAGLIEMTWVELADVFNKNLREPGEEWGESAYRKKYANMRRFRDEFPPEDTTSGEVDELKELRIELEKERVKVRDERNQYRKLIREEARKEAYQDQLLQSIEEAAGEHPLEYEPTDEIRIKLESESDMIIPLFDLHAGIEISNFWNHYDGEVLKYRLQHYMNRIIEIQERHKCQDAYVVASELLSGIIHPTLRIQNNQDLIDQFLMVMDYMCDFLAELSGRFKHVRVYVAPGNHSRINPKKEQDIAHENMDNLVIPFLRAKMQNYENVYCYINDIEQSMAIFPVRNLNVCAVHGDKDNFKTVATRLNKMFRIHIDLIITGHRHTNAFMTDGDVKVVQSGCLSGSDDFAIQNRLTNRPEQAVCIITATEGLDCIYDVKF